MSDNLLWMQNPELANAMRRQKMGQQLMQQGSDSSPIQSPWQGVARLAQALVGGYEARKGRDEITGAGERRKAELAAIMGGGAPQPTAQPAMQGQPPAPSGVSPELLGMVTPIAQKYGVPLNVALGLVLQESGGNPGAVGDGGQSVGLGQIQAATARQPGYGVPPMDPAKRGDPAANLDFAMNYLTSKGRHIGATDWNNPEHVDKALAAYNGGGDPNYVQNVRGRMPGDMAAPVAGPGGAQPPQGMPPAQQGAPQPNTPEFHMNRAQQLQAAGFPQQAQMEMQRAQMAQRAVPQPTEFERILQAAGLPPGSPEAQRLLRQYAERKGAPPTTNVTVGNENMLGRELAKGTADQLAKSREHAMGAEKGVQSAQRILDTLDSGAITGVGADWRLSAARALAAVGLIDGKVVANTESLMSELAKNVLAESQVMAGVLSDRDIEFLRDAAQGKIAFTQESLRRAAGLAALGHGRLVERYNDLVGTMAEDDQLPAVTRRLYSPMPVPQLRGREPAGAAAPPQPGQQPGAGEQIAVNPQTGEKLILRNGRWERMQ